MGHSIQAANGKAAILDDATILALICLAGEAVDAAPDAYPVMEPVVAQWERNCDGYGPGTIDLDLDSLLSQANASNELRRLLVDVESRAARFGKNIPSSVLNGRCRAPGVRFLDYPVSNLTSAT